MREQSHILKLLRASSPAGLLLAVWWCASFLLPPDRLPGPFQSIRLMYASGFGDPVISAQGGGVGLRAACYLDILARFSGCRSGDCSGDRSRVG
jgi:hypothetical protein